MILKGYFGSSVINPNTHKEEFKPYNNAFIILKNETEAISIRTNSIGGYTAEVPNGTYNVSFSFSGTSRRVIAIRRGASFTVDATTKADALDEWIKSNEISEDGEDYDHTDLEQKIIALESGKADKSAITPLATKASVELKADKTALDSLATKASVEAKADKTALTPLATKTEVESKADKTSLTSLATKTEVNAKADKTALTSLATKTEVDAKADKTALDAKADKTALTPLALKTEVEKKVDKTLYDALVKRVEALEAPAG